MSNLWLYQLSAAVYPHAGYRLDVWEGSITRWGTGKVDGQDEPATGDRIVTWFARTVSDEPGIWGWGVILSADEDELRWQPVFPSNLLKMGPLFSDALDACINRIRGPVHQGTMWQVDPADAQELTDAIAARWR